MNKNIGIIGYWFATNYGGVLSYFSLYQKVKSLGYNPFLVESPYADVDKEGYDTFSRKFMASENCDISDFYSLENQWKLNDKADCFLLGSDQVFTTSSLKAFGKSFLMSFLNPDKKRLAISASCGGDDLKGLAPELVSFARAELCKFASVSVREDTAVNIVRRAFNIDAEQIIDPIFFSTKDSLSQLVSDIKPKKNKELFAYILDPSDDKRNLINQLSMDLGYDCHVALDGRKYTHNANLDKLALYNITLPELDEYDWIANFRDASFVLTDSFHGMAMALIFQKPFLVYANPSRGYARFRSLLESLGLMDRMIMNSSEYSYDIASKSIDYSNISDMINESTQHAENWLKEHFNFNTDENNTEPYTGKFSSNKDNKEYSICSHSLCTGCSACANVCPKECIYMIRDNEGFLYPYIDRDKCINCGQCEATCPILNKPPIKEFPKKAYAGFSKNSDVRYNSTSGGAFTEFANFIFKMNGVCYGAIYDNAFMVRHERISTIENLYKVRQSKYVQSYIGDTFKRVKDDLEKGLYVLFVGTPCQCFGLKNYLKKDYDRLLTIDFICHSISSPKAYLKYLDDLENIYGRKISRVWFKNKESTWLNFSLRIDFNDEDPSYYIKNNKEDAFFKGFLKYRLFQRPSCHNCKFKGTARISDVTLADFWGLKWKTPQLINDDKKDGVSLIILNSKKGSDIFDMFVKYHMYCESHKLSDAITANGGYMHSQSAGWFRDYFFNTLDNLPFHSIIEKIDNAAALLNKKE